MRLTAHRGFIEHGHLYGEAALIVTCGRNDDRIDLPQAITPPERVHFLIESAQEAAQASKLSEVLAKTGVRRISASVCPGVAIPRSALAYESVLVYSGLDQDVAGSETSVASVSVHVWPGSAVLDTLEARFEAHRGRFLVMPKDEVGDAKVWLSSTRNPHWKILPAYPFNRAEDAELMEMLK